MELTVLGKSPAWSDAGGACSGYLVREAGTTVLLDCGPGVFGKLRAVVPYTAVDAVVLTHRHSDHTLDVVPFLGALAFGPHKGERRPRLIVPAGATAALEQVLAAGFMPEELLTSVFAVEEYAPGDSLEVGPLRVALEAVPHYQVPTCAVAVTSGGARAVYGADCAPNDAVVALAEGADLAVLEATLRAPEPEPPRGHLTPFEAGELARRAGVRRLVVTHFTDELDAGWIGAEAARGFGGEVDLASGGASYSMP